MRLILPTNFWWTVKGFSWDHEILTDALRPVVVKHKKYDCFTSYIKTENPKKTWAISMYYFGVNRRALWGDALNLKTRDTANFIASIIILIAVLTYSKY